MALPSILPQDLAKKFITRVKQGEAQTPEDLRRIFTRYHARINPHPETPCALCVSYQNVREASAKKTFINRLVELSPRTMLGVCRIYREVQPLFAPLAADSFMSQLKERPSLQNALSGREIIIVFNTHVSPSPHLTSWHQTMYERLAVILFRHLEAETHPTTTDHYGKMHAEVVDCFPPLSNEPRELDSLLEERVVKVAPLELLAAAQSAQTIEEVDALFHASNSNSSVALSAVHERYEKSRQNLERCQKLSAEIGDLVQPARLRSAIPALLLQHAVQRTHQDILRAAQIPAGRLTLSEPQIEVLLKRTADVRTRRIIKDKTLSGELPKETDVLSAEQREKFQQEKQTIRAKVEQDVQADKNQLIRQEVERLMQEQAYALAIGDFSEDEEEQEQGILEETLGTVDDLAGAILDDLVGQLIAERRDIKAARSARQEVVQAHDAANVS